MRSNPFYKYLGIALMAVFVLSLGFSLISETALAQGSLQTPKDDTNYNDTVAQRINEGDNPTYDDVVNQRADEIANPSYDDVVNDRINETQNPSNTSANGQSQNASAPGNAATGGNGQQDTSFSLRMLSPYYFIPAMMKILGNMILGIFGWVLGLVGLIFNFIIDKTIVNLKTTIDSLGVINDIWKVIRDFINLFFIFALLYAAVGTILGLEKVDWKKTVSNLIIAALLMNFSLFITKVVLDVSNIVTIGFYNQLPGVGAQGLVGADKGISNSIMQSLKLETIYKPKYTGTAIGDMENSPATAFAYVLSTFMASIFICVTIVVIVAAGWLFLRRFIDIIFLMIRSPIAFAGLVLPQLDEYQKNWWKELQANATFPPVYMAMMWITFKILQSPGFQTVAPGVDGFSGLFSSLTGTTINIVFRFIVVIAMMVYALKSAGKVGIEGGEIFTEFLSKKKGQLKGVIGRNTLGRAAAAARESGFAKNVEAISPLAGRLMNSNLKTISGASFGGAKGGFDAAVKQSEKDAKEGYERVSKAVAWTEAAPYKRTFESDEAFAARNTAYTERKAAFEKEAGKDKEKRQKDYVESLKTGVPVLPDLNVGVKTNIKALDPSTWTKENLKNTKVSANIQPFRVGEEWKENISAVNAVDEQIKEDAKKEDKKTRAKTDLGRIKTEQAEAEEEMLASYKKYAEAAGATPEAINKLVALLTKRFEDIPNEGERIAAIAANKQEIRSVLEEIQVSEERKIEEETKKIAQQEATMRSIEIELNAAFEEKRSAEKPTTEKNIQRLQGELAAATLNRKVLEKAPDKRAGFLKTAESKKNEAATKREQVITRENQLAQEEKLDTLGKDIGAVKESSGKKDDDGGGKGGGKPKEDKK